MLSWNVDLARPLETPGNLAACHVGQAAVNLFDQVLDRDVACKLAAILVMVLFDTRWMQRRSSI
jgi:hypothetical protein